MGFKELFGSSKKKKTEEPEPTTQQVSEKDNTCPSQSHISELFAGMPIEVMRDYTDPIFTGKLGPANGGGRLHLIRIAGELSLPPCEIGTDVIVRGYDERLDPVIFHGKVEVASTVEWIIGDICVDHYTNHRWNTRCPVQVPAKIYHVKDKYFGNPEECTIFNISTGGACITSTYKYTLGEELRIRIELVKGEGFTTYKCQIVRVVEKTDGRFEYGLLFEQLDNRRAIMLNQQLNAIQKNKEKWVSA